MLTADMPQPLIVQPWIIPSSPLTRIPARAGVAQRAIENLEPFAAPLRVGRLGPAGTGRARSRVSSSPLSGVGDCAGPRTWPGRKTRGHSRCGPVHSRRSCRGSLFPGSACSLRRGPPSGSCRGWRCSRPATRPPRRNARRSARSACRPSGSHRPRRRPVGPRSLPAGFGPRATRQSR